MKQNIFLALSFGCVSFFVGTLYSADYYNIQTVNKNQLKLAAGNAISEKNLKKKYTLSLENIRNFTQFQLNPNSESRSFYIIDKPNSNFMKLFVNQEFLIKAKVNFVPYFDVISEESTIQHIYCLNNNPGLTMYNYTLNQPLPLLNSCNISSILKNNQTLHMMNIEKLLPIVVFDSGDIVFNATQSNQSLINEVISLTKPKYIDLDNYKPLINVTKTQQPKPKAKSVQNIMKISDKQRYEEIVKNDLVEYTNMSISKYLIKSNVELNTDNYNFTDYIKTITCYQQLSIGDMMLAWLPVVPDSIAPPEDNIVPGAIPPLMGKNHAKVVRKFKFIKSENVSGGGLTVITHEPPKAIKVNLPKFARFGN